MKKQINLFFDFEFTSLSPDAQPISLGIICDVLNLPEEPKYNYQVAGKPSSLNPPMHVWYVNKPNGLCVLSEANHYSKDKALEEFYKEANKIYIETRTFYAEFSDFNVNRCDACFIIPCVEKIRISVGFGLARYHTHYIWPRFVTFRKSQRHSIGCIRLSNGIMTLFSPYHHSRKQ